MSKVEREKNKLKGSDTMRETIEQFEKDGMEWLVDRYNVIEVNGKKFVDQDWAFDYSVRLDILKFVSEWVVESGEDLENITQDQMEVLYDELVDAVYQDDIHALTWSEYNELAYQLVDGIMGW